MLTSCTQLIGGDAAVDKAGDAVQIFGGYGLRNKNPVTRHYRDSKVLERGEGTTEVQFTVSARSLGFAA